MADWSLALRNLLRNRRRSLSTLLALAIGLAAVLLFNGFKEDIRYAMLTATVRANGHLQVQHRDYFLYGSGNPTAYAMGNEAALAAAIQADPILGPMVSVVTPMLRFGGLAGNFEAGISRTVIGTGYVAEDIEKMRQWNEFGVPVVPPRFALLGKPLDSAVIGVGVARVLQLCDTLQVEDCAQAEEPVQARSTPGRALPKDLATLAASEHLGGSGQAGRRIELLISGSRGAPNVATLEVAAAENQGIKELDEITVLVHLAQAQRLVFGRSTQRVTAIMVQLKKTADLARAAARLGELISSHAPQQPLAVRDFIELFPFYAQAVDLFDVIFGFIFVLIGGIVLFTVGNTMNTAVVERTVEIGTLRAIGLRQAGVRRLFVIEGFILGCIGAALGIVVAIALGALVNHLDLTWLPPGDSERQPLQLRVLADVWTLTMTALSLVAIAAASAWLPAWRAAHLNVVDALRHA